MKASEKIIKAKARLILEQPFFATIALHLQFKEEWSIDNGDTDGKVVRYNPGYIDTLDVEEVKGFIGHEVMHIANFHHTRRNHRNKKKWNMACDYAINPLLIDSGFVLPKGALSCPDYKDKSAEQIYDLIPDPDPSAPPGLGDIQDPPPEAGSQVAEMQVKQMLVQAAMVAKRQGKLGDGLERLIEQGLKPKICWQEVLSRFISEIARSDYSWQKPAVRFLYRGLYLPSLESTETGSIILLVDTSISIDQGMINQFGSEVQEITSTFNVPLKVIYIDTIVRAVQDIEPDEPIQLTPKGGGGTDFRPGFLYIDNNDLQPKAVVYLTDGECNDFPDTPDYPVLWAQFGASHFNPPFGEVVQVTE